MFIDKLSFIAESHISGHFINDALTTTDLDAFGISCNVCRGSQCWVIPEPTKKQKLVCKNEKNDQMPILYLLNYIELSYSEITFTY